MVNKMMQLGAYDRIRGNLENSRKHVIEIRTDGFLKGTIAKVVSRYDSPGSIEILEESVEVPYHNDGSGNPDEIRACEYRVLVLEGKGSKLHSYGRDYIYQLLNAGKWYNQKEDHIRNITSGDCDLPDEKQTIEIIRQTYIGVPADQISTLLEIYSKQVSLTNFEKMCGKYLEWMENDRK